MRLLARYLATWTDGKQLVIHAREWTAADDLARRLEAPPGVSVRSVQGLDS